MKSFKRNLSGKSITRLNILRISLAFVVAGAALFCQSCKKLVEIGPPATSINDANVFTSDNTAIAVLTGLYASMSGDNSYSGELGIAYVTGLSGDELGLDGGISNPNMNYAQFYGDNLPATSLNVSTGSQFWTQNYSFIFQCNAAIGGLTAATTLTPAVKQQLLGEAKFIRALNYFYLVNLYGNVPLALTTDYQVNQSLSRSSVKTVYQQIIADLQSAKSLMQPTFVDATISPTTERTRPNKWAAQALLARVYLYSGDNKDAIIQADSVINQSSLFSLTSLNNTFLANSQEAIWQLQPVNQGWNTEDARYFIIPSTGFDDATWQVYLSGSLLNSFEPGDQRKSNWVSSVVLNGQTYYYPYKYKSATYGAPVTEYLMVLRLGEQYLIRAEAKANLGDATAVNDLNTIRSRAGLPNYSGSSLLTAIQHERQIELFTEMGHRWLDLKRNGTVDAVMSTVTPLKANGAAWQSYQQFYPLPYGDIKADPSLVQNQGY